MAARGGGSYTATRPGRRKGPPGAHGCLGIDSGHGFDLVLVGTGAAIAHVVHSRFLGSLYGRCRMKLKEADLAVGESAFLKVIENVSSPL
jgi:hypothetical protein